MDSVFHVFRISPECVGIAPLQWGTGGEGRGSNCQKAAVWANRVEEA